jgi:putative MFS transporter
MHAKVVSVPGQFGRPALFWLGVALITVGVAISFFDFLERRALGHGFVYMTPLNLLGMALDLGGFAATTIGLLPRGLSEILARRHRGHIELAATDIPVANDSSLAAMDSTGLTGTHWRMISRLFVGAALDTMKPATLGYMLPGLRAEYGLTTAQVAIYPLAALCGLTIGSVLFGRVGDWIGRRASFVLTALVLAVTGLCGFMPGFQWQLGLCFTMGLAAGGELPVIYTLLAETMPARHRGWLSVGIGGAGGLAGYFCASLWDYTMEPIFSWRILWFANLPTALIMLLLIKWVPESPRYLLDLGFVDEARKIMASVGVKTAALAGNANANASTEKHGIRELFQRGLIGTTLLLVVYGIAWGVCNWGFILFLPTILRNGKFLDPTVVSGVLATSTLFAAPATLAAAALYGFWSSKWAAVIFALGSGVVLILLGFGQDLVRSQPVVLSVALVALLICTSSMIGILAPYSTELFPTALRGVGSGVVTGSSKAGGLIGPPIMGVILGIAPGLLVPALVVGLPMLAAGALMAVRAPETRGRRLEELALPVTIGAGH